METCLKITTSNRVSNLICNNTVSHKSGVIRLAGLEEATTKLESPNMDSKHEEKGCCLSSRCNNFVGSVDEGLGHVHQAPNV